MVTTSVLKYLVGFWANVILIAAVYRVGGPRIAAFTALHLIPCEMGFMMMRRRGFLFVLAHLLVIDFGLWFGSLDSNLSYGGLQGLALISLPIIVFFWIWLLVFSGFVLPVHPERHELENAALCLIGFVTGYHYSYHVVKGDKIEERLTGKVMRRGLFPGLVLADAHTAVPVSTGVGLSRIAGPGVTFIGRAERPHNGQVIDLSTQARLAKVRATTRDGIDVQVGILVNFRIEPIPPMRPPASITPVSEVAAFKAVIAQRSDLEKEVEWGDIPLMLARNIVRSVISQYQFDRLLEGEAPLVRPAEQAAESIAERRRRLAQQRQARMPREEIQNEIARRLRAEFQDQNLGLRLNFAALGDIDIAGPTDEDLKAAEQTKTEKGEQAKKRVEQTTKLREDIISQRIMTWQVEWLSEAIRRQAQSEAEATREIGRARAQAQMRMIQALTEGLAQAHNMGLSVPTDVVVLLRLLDALEEMSLEPGTRERLSAEALHAQATMKRAALRAAGH